MLEPMERKIARRQKHWQALLRKRKLKDSIRLAKSFGWINPASGRPRVRIRRFTLAPSTIFGKYSPGLRLQNSADCPAARSVSIQARVNASVATEWVSKKSKCNS